MKLCEWCRDKVVDEKNGSQFYCSQECWGLARAGKARKKLSPLKSDTKTKNYERVQL